MKTTRNYVERRLGELRKIPEQFGRRTLRQRYRDLARRQGLRAL